MALGQLCVFPAARAPTECCFELIFSIPLRIPPLPSVISVSSRNDETVLEPQPEEQTEWEVVKDVFFAP